MSRHKKQTPAEMFGHRVAARRNALKMSQETLAEKADISRNLVGLVENGLTNPTLKTMRKIAKALGVNMNDLLDGL